MTETFLNSKINRPIFQDLSKQHQWSYIDTITQELTPFEADLSKAFKSTKDNGQVTFLYQRNLIDFTLSSRIMKCDLTKLSMTDMSTGNVFTIKREENSNYNYLVNQAHPHLKSEPIQIVEVKKEEKLVS